MIKLMMNAVDDKQEIKTSTGLTKVNPNTVFPSHNFKYYIHDTAQGYRLELLGDLTDHQVSELNCCWLTARNTLKNRKLVLDLRGVRHVDERGRQWLAGMALEGAAHIPESFLRDTLAGDSSSRNMKSTVKFSLLDRLLTALRGYTAAE